jgi:D-sedoheptulose 7-phosphate isomerase
MLEQRIQQQFFESADLLSQTADALSKPIADAAQALLGCITAGGKVMLCGSGPTAALAQHGAALMVGRFERERPGLAALAVGGSEVLARCARRAAGHQRRQPGSSPAGGGAGRTG